MSTSDIMAISAYDMIVTVMAKIELLDKPGLTLLENLLKDLYTEEKWQAEVRDNLMWGIRINQMGGHT